MLSMSGYGKGVAEDKSTVVSIELKSVNHRFLDLAIKMPRSFNCLEERVRLMLKSSLTRGRVDVFIFISQSEGSSLEFKLNQTAVEGYLNFASDLSSKYGIDNDIKVSDIFKLKDVFIDVDITPNSDEIWKLVESALSHAINDLIIMRANEGSRIQANINQKLDNIFTSVAAIEEYAPKQIEEYKIKLLARVAEALQNVAVDESKLMNEVVFYADKVSTDEEFVRLYAHIDHFREIMKGEIAFGRSLDFIIQEMNREANTIGSKCSDLSVANHVLNMKTEIEKLREQIQNIE